MAELPWLDYAGQTTSELLAHKNTHRVDSLLCAFEEGILAKAKDQVRLTTNERVIVAVMALEREVNNGGYDQFFASLSFAVGAVGNR